MSLPVLADPAGEATAPSSAPATPVADEGFGEVVSVSLTFFRSRIVDPSGRPILGLEPQDLVVNVGAKEIPIAALDWYEEPLPLAAEVGDPENLPAAPRIRVSHRGQVFVFLVDVDPGAGLRAELEQRRQYLAAVRALIDSLPAGAYAAVLSRDTHLKLRQDFTTDRKLVSTALHEAVRGGNGSKPSPAPAGTESTRPFLLPHFDENRARLAVSTDLAFEETARALDPLPGEKVLIYLRLGLGNFEETRGGAMAEEMVEAIQALQAARASVFVLDHYGRPGMSFNRFTPSILTLEQVVMSTGGTYVSARPDPHPAAKRLAQTIRGYYLVTLDPTQLPQEKTPQRVTVKLRKKRGEVLSTPVWTLMESAPVNQPLRSAH